MSELEKSPARPTDAWRTAAIGSGAFVALLWVIEIVDALLKHRLDGGGILPRETDGLDGILWAPLLHGGWDHLIGNTVPALILCFVVMMSGLKVWAKSTAIIWVVAGVGTWLTGGDHTVHIGASSLIFGWVVYLVLRGFFHRNTTHILVGVIVFVAYGTMLLGVLPGQDGVSWQGHLFGALGGALAAWLGDGWGRPRAGSGSTLAAKDVRQPKAPKAPKASKAPTSGPARSAGTSSSPEDEELDKILRDLGL